MVLYKDLQYSLNIEIYYLQQSSKKKNCFAPYFKPPQTFFNSWKSFTKQQKLEKNMLLFPF